LERQDLQIKTISLITLPLTFTVLDGHPAPEKLVVEALAYITILLKVGVGMWLVAVKSKEGYDRRKCI
jgi:hypothetical protein